MNTIVVATDGSAEAELAVHEGLELAGRVDAHVTFVSVRDAISAPPRGEHERAQAIAAGLSALDAALAEADRRGVAADAEATDGDPRAEILRIAHRMHADLIVLGSSRRGHDVSVSDELPRHTNIPVLVVGATSA